MIDICLSLVVIPEAWDSFHVCVCYVRLERKRAKTDSIWSLARSTAEAFVWGFICSSSNHLTAALFGSVACRKLLLKLMNDVEVTWAPCHQSRAPRSLCNFWELSTWIRDTAPQKKNHLTFWTGRPSAGPLHSRWLFYHGKVQVLFLLDGGLLHYIP